MTRIVTPNQAAKLLSTCNYLSPNSNNWQPHQENWIIHFPGGQWGSELTLHTNQVYLSNFGWQLNDVKLNDRFNLVRESIRQKELANE